MPGATSPWPPSASVYSRTQLDRMILYPVVCQPLNYTCGSDGNPDSPLQPWRGCGTSLSSINQPRNRYLFHTVSLSVCGTSKTHCIELARHTHTSGRQKRWAASIAAVVGFAVTAISLVQALIPDQDVENPKTFYMMVFGSLAFNLAVIAGVYIAGRRHRRRYNSSSSLP